MVFSSAVFLFLFLPFVPLGNILLPRIWMKNVFLMLVSLFFYAWGEQFFVMIMLASVALNYVMGLLVSGRRRKLWLTVAIVLNLVLLGWFKYANFGVAMFNGILGWFGHRPVHLNPVHLPIGISFFTFHALSYVIDVYRGDATRQRRLLNIGVYISMFPQLIAGPIVRYKDVAEQISQRRVSFQDFNEGIRTFAIGLGKKMILANTLAEVADRVFGLPAPGLNAGLAWLGVACYTLQIYFDFSGYSDMALGLGRMFGFHFLENFRHPYISQSVREFWRRWHISLSNWFRDYLYIPLGGNRCPPWRTYLNLVIVFFLCGLWHGASWTFVFWGLYHGVFLALERMGLEAWLARRWRLVRHAYLLLMVTIGWVFFRSETLPQAMTYLAAMFGLGAGDGMAQNAAMYLDPAVIVTLAVAAVAATPIWPWVRDGWRVFTAGRAPLFQIASAGASAAIGLVYVPLLLLLSAMLLANGTYNPFIYFRF